MKTSKHNVTSLILQTSWWLIGNFLINLVIFSPMYWIFPLFRSYFEDKLGIQDRAIEVLSPIVADAPVLEGVASRYVDASQWLFTIFWALVCLALSFLFINLVREYVTYFFKAGHIACICAHVRGKKVKSQIRFGTSSILKRFGSVNFMFAADKLTKKAVLELNSYLFRDSSFLPKFVKNSKLLSSFMKKVIRMLLIHLDEVTLSYVMMYKGKVWGLYCQCLARYVQTWKGIVKESLKTVIAVTVLELITKYAVYAICFVSLIKYGLVDVIMAIALARWVLYCLRVTFLDAYEYTRIMLVFYENIDNVQASPSIMEKLGNISTSFRNMLKKSGREEAKNAVASTITETLTLDGTDFGELAKMGDNSLVPTDLGLKSLFSLKQRRGKNDGI